MQIRFLPSERVFVHCVVFRSSLFVRFFTCRGGYQPTAATERMRVADPTALMLMMLLPGRATHAECDDFGTKTGERYVSAVECKYIQLAVGGGEWCVSNVRGMTLEASLCLVLSDSATLKRAGRMACTLSSEGPPAIAGRFESSRASVRAQHTAKG